MTRKKDSYLRTDAKRCRWKSQKTILRSNWSPQEITEPDYHEFNDLTTEHVIIEAEASEEDEKPVLVNQRQYLKNSLHGTVTEVTFYDGGFLKIREGSKTELLKEHVLELRFINPKPVTVRQFATPWLWLSLASGLAAVVAPVFMPATQYAKFSSLAAITTAVLAAVFLLTFVYRSKVNHQFCTASGKADVVSLTGAFGCFRHARVLAVQIEHAIERACVLTGVHDIRYLRAEMQAHYKLAETGVISRKECSDGTALILSKFG